MDSALRWGRSGALFFPDLVQRLAVDTQIRCRPGFETLYPDFDAAVFTKTIIPFIKINQRVIDFLDKFPFPISGSQLQGAVSFQRGAIVWVGQVDRFILHNRHRPFDVINEFLFPGSQDSAEVLGLNVSHIRFATLGTMRLDAMNEFFGSFFLCCGHWFTLRPRKKSVKAGQKGGAI